jgi:hypothetical protein
MPNFAQLDLDLYQRHATPIGKGCFSPLPEIAARSTAALG